MWRVAACFSFVSLFSLTSCSEVATKEDGAASVAKDMQRTTASPTNLPMSSPPPTVASACDALHPKEGLKWTSSYNQSGWMIYAGTLTAPLSPYPEDRERTPYIDLVVTMAIPPGKNAAHLEPLLHHCGGPGSDATCVFDNFLDDQYSNYVGWSISQRGIGSEAKPSFECSPDTLKLPLAGKESYAISDFTDCECALPDGAPLVGQSFASIDPSNESEVLHVYTKMMERSTRCPAADKWKLKGPTHEVFNFLEWSGTSMLAWDIELFRTSICAAKMHINGGSYGTAVGAVYANKFPKSVARVMLNGNMPPDPDTNAAAQGQGMALTQAFAHLALICAASKTTPPCDKFNSSMALEVAWSKLLESIRKGQLSAATNLTANGKRVMMPITIGMVGGYVQEQMIGAGFAPIGWAPVLHTIVNLAGKSGLESQQRQIRAILDRYCTLPDGYPEVWNNVKTWFTYGVCVGQQSVGVSSRNPNALAGKLGLNMYRMGTDGFMNEAAVQGQDWAGRYVVSQAMGLWRQYSSTWGEMATGSYVGIFSEVFAWGANPTPVQAGYRQDIEAFLVANLYDPATAFAWSNSMRQSFPDASIIVWQGVGHMTTAGGNYPNSGMAPCLAHMEMYWKEGVLPVDGFTCRQNASLPLGPPNSIVPSPISSTAMTVKTLLGSHGSNAMASKTVSPIVVV